jgi:hypothetical protein
MTLARGRRCTALVLVQGRAAKVCQLAHCGRPRSGTGEKSASREMHTRCQYAMIVSSIQGFAYLPR